MVHGGIIGYAWTKLLAPTILAKRTYFPTSPRQSMALMPLKDDTLYCLPQGRYLGNPCHPVAPFDSQDALFVVVFILSIRSSSRCFCLPCEVFLFSKKCVAFLVSALPAHLSRDVASSVSSRKPLQLPNVGLISSIQLPLTHWTYVLRVGLLYST